MAVTDNPTTPGTHFTPEQGVDFSQLYAALVECFGIVLLGFLAGRFNFISDLEAKGLNTFVGTFALPALIFGSLCNLDISSVQWMFVLAIFIAKASLFCVVLLIGLLVMKSTDRAKAGLFAIFVTQSNDFALGYPILKAIYEKTHPEYPMYLYLLAPISLVILNPVGFICMELGSSEDHNISKRKRALNVMKNIAKNPIVFMTVAGVAGNFIFQESLPSILDQFLGTLGSAFSASALFLLGLRMVGKRSKGLQSSDFAIALILILLKTVALPIIAREVMSALHVGGNNNETELLSNFAFIYGTFPTAPSVFVFASQYDVLPELTASAMVACTFIAAPVMFISARLISITDIDPADYIGELDNFLLDVSVIALFASMWVTLLFITTKKYQRMPHFMTLILVTSQSIACIGAILWSVFDYTHGWKLYLQFFLFGYGGFATKINTALLAITMFLAQVKPMAVVLKWRKPFFSASLILPFVLVMAVMVSVGNETVPHGQKTDPNYQYGNTQASVVLIVQIVSFCITVTSMIMTQRFQGINSNGEVSDQTEIVDGPTRQLLCSASGMAGSTCASYSAINIESKPNEQTEEQVETVIEDSPDAGSEQQQSRQRLCRCQSEVEGILGESAGQLNLHDFQEFRHNLLLLFLSTSMFVGIALSICILVIPMANMSGIFLELIFLDGFLNFGQGLFTLAIFGLDVDFVTGPIRRWWARLRGDSAGTMYLSRLDDLEARQQCQQFINHHIDNCKDSLLKDITCAGSGLHNDVFRGVELVDWLLELGLARDRSEGIVYGRHLIKGGIFRHISSDHDFHDNTFIYTFEPQ